VFLDVTRRRNSQLIRAAVALHQAGRIPSNCYVIDADTVERNAALVAELAAQEGLKLFQMTKQFGRNPLVAARVARSGMAVVAVDFEEARLLHAAGLKIGHLGHLVQIPRAEVERAVSMDPEFITVFNVEQAARIAAAARSDGREQQLLLRIVGEDDVFYPGQRGGVPESEAVEVARTIDGMPGVRVAGVTTFPCLLWQEDTARLEPTPNITTIGNVAQRLRGAGIDVTVINAPSATCAAVLPALSRLGATHVEPGSCLTGHTPLHAVSDQPELPAMVYVSEVAHVGGDTAYSLAGGLYPRSRARTALIYPTGEEDEPVKATVHLEPPETIDYYGTLDVSKSARRPEVGQTIVYAFRAQVFVSRSFVAVVSGVGSTPTVDGIFDRNGNCLNDNLLAGSQASGESRS
jgi:predicted amino acid racemase